MSQLIRENIPAPSVRGEAGASRGHRPPILSTLIAEFLFHDPTPVWTASLLRALGLLGVDAAAARKALARMAETGWMKSERFARQTRWNLTEQARKDLELGMPALLHFGSMNESWDGRWTTVLVTVPETQRELRYRLKLDLPWIGFGQLASGVWVKPSGIGLERTRAVLERLGLLGRAYVTIGSLAHGDPKEVAERAYGLSDLESRYETFLKEMRLIRADTPQDAFIALVQLTHAWRWFPTEDPQLPMDLLPAPWIGSEAADAFRTTRAQLLERAWAGWREINKPDAGA